MSDQVRNAQDPVDRQVAALQALAQRVTERTTAETKLEQDHAQRTDAARRAFEQASKANDAQYQQQRTALDRRAKEVPTAATASFEASKAEADTTLQAAKTRAEQQYRERIETIKQAQADQRWEVGTICEAGLNDAKGELERTQNQLTEVNGRLKAIRVEIDQHLKSCRLQSAARGVEVEPQATANSVEHPTADAANQALDEAEQRFDDLRNLTLPGLFRGIRPAALVLVPSVLGAGGGFFLQQSWVGPAAGGGIGAIVGVILATWLYATARVQVQRALGPLQEAIGRAADQVVRSRKEAVAAHGRREQDLLSTRDREQAAADARAKAAAAEAKSQAQTAIARADEAHRAAIAKATATRDELLRKIQEEVERLTPEIQKHFETERDRLRVEYDQATAAARQRTGAEATTLADRWRKGLAQVQETLALVDAEIATRFPSFEAAAREDAPVPKEVPPALRFGRLRVDLDMFPQGRPADPALMEGLPDHFEPPAIVRSPDGCSFLLKADAEGRSAALGAMQAVMLRILTGFPPGKARFTMIDPVGLGQTFAAFMHLADVDEQLVTNRVWTETQHIEQRLQDLTEHMENVIQKYLRNEYHSITEYNARAGEVAEPFRFLVVADFPVRFNEAAARRLLSIAQSGPRCGVHVIVLVDVRQELPQGIDLKDLERHCAVLHWREGRVRWSDPLRGGFPLKLDEPPPPDVFSGVVRAVGKRAEGASRVEVPFDFLAPPPEDYWRGDSGKGVAIPLGRAGATKIQQLKLGSGTAQHVLIAGKTGSGKSTLLHAMITSAALTYAPDQLELYLIDFKKGVEFKAYATHHLPHARVIAVESEREFGLSVLLRLDAELGSRGDLFREAGTQDVAAFRVARPDVPMPRILLIVDEFQEFFVEDDKIAQEAALLLDRLVRQGRAFGIHVHLGSQTLAGAYTLARATIGQMAVRIALQCSEADASLILSDDNTAARLLSRPGEAIYNDANGRLEGNNIFQVVWLPDERREEYLRRIASLADERNVRVRKPIVFEGNIAPDPANNEPLATLLEAEAYPDPLPKASLAWLGEPVAIKAPTAMHFRRLAGAHLLIVGQNEEAARGLMAMTMISLAAHRPDARFVLLDGTPADDPRAGDLPRIALALPNEALASTWGQVESSIADVAAEVERRRDEGITDAAPLYLLIHDLQRFRQLRKSEDDFSFSTPDPNEPAKPSELLGTILRDGPIHGVHVIMWVDTLNNLNRTFDRATLRELEHRVLFQMSSADSSTLIDSPLANRLGMQRALLVSEEAGQLEKFRPYGPPSEDWVREAVDRLGRRSSRPSEGSV
ncbi:FtsK/SpoIIIE domain-containing protein [Tautonia marina]|uniref:FtsK/SpoIIIE domain-containing protein n=1 Tax=Tautonia marina TaxID=2653855 RepID=UPI0013761433|nr:FtsK/SpoIIIE domain-containing protein [Tautonia marina]